MGHWNTPGHCRLFLMVAFCTYLPEIFLWAGWRRGGSAWALHPRSHPQPARDRSWWTNLSTLTLSGWEWVEPHCLQWQSTLFPPLSHSPTSSWDHLLHKTLPQFLFQGLLLGEPQIQQKTDSCAVEDQGGVNSVGDPEEWGPVQMCPIGDLYICIYMNVYMHILFHILFHYSLLQDIEYSSLCYTVGPCCLSIVYVVICIR